MGECFGKIMTGIDRAAFWNLYRIPKLFLGLVISAVRIKKSLTFGGGGRGGRTRRRAFAVHLYLLGLEASFRNRLVQSTASSTDHESIFKRDKNIMFKFHKARAISALT